MDSKTTSKKTLPPPLTLVSVSAEDTKSASEKDEKNAGTLLLRPSEILLTRKSSDTRKGKEKFEDALNKEMRKAKRAALAAEKKKRKKQAAKRLAVAKELISTEENYVKSLHNLVKYYVDPLRRKIGSANEVLNREEFEAVFANVDQLLPLNQKLLESLKKVGPEGNIGGVFLRFAPFLKMYSIYLDRAEKSIEALQARFEADLEVTQSFAALDAIGGGLSDLDASTMNKKSLKNFCKDANAKSCERLQSLLIKPVQRIPRYRMLLEVILKVTPREDSEVHAEVGRALALICETALHVNDSVRRNQDALDMAAMYKRFRGAIPPVVWPRHDRILVKAGEVQEFAKKASVWRTAVSISTRYYVLFSDGLACCASAAYNHLQLRFWFPLSTMSFGTILGSSRGFRITGSAYVPPVTSSTLTEGNGMQTSVLCNVGSTGIATEWMDAFREAFRARAKDRSNRRQNYRVDTSSSSSIVGTRLGSKGCDVEEAATIVSRACHFFMAPDPLEGLLKCSLGPLRSAPSIAKMQSATAVSKIDSSGSDALVAAVVEVQRLRSSRVPVVESPCVAKTMPWDFEIVESAPVFFEGYLLKRSRDAKWQKRYFRVTAPFLTPSGNVVCAFLGAAKNEAVGTSPKYLACIDSSAKISEATGLDSSENRERCFEVSFGDFARLGIDGHDSSKLRKSVTLQAVSGSLKREWMIQLTDAIALSTKALIESRVDEILHISYGVGGPSMNSLPTSSSTDVKGTESIYHMLSRVHVYEKQKRWHDASDILLRACSFARERSDRVLGFRCLLWLGECCAAQLRTALSQAANDALSSYKDFSKKDVAASTRPATALRYHSRLFSSTFVNTIDGTKIPVVATPSSSLLSELAKGAILGAFAIVNEIADGSVLPEDARIALFDSPSPDAIRAPPIPPVALAVKKRLSMESGTALTEERLRRWVSALVTALAQIFCLVPEKQLVFLNLLSFAQSISRGEYVESPHYERSLRKSPQAGWRNLAAYAMEIAKGICDGVADSRLLSVGGESSDDEGDELL